MISSTQNDKILILGAKGMLGTALLKVFPNAVGWDRGDCDVTQFDSLKLKVESLKPSVIINCVAYNNVDAAEDFGDVAYKLNFEVPKYLSEICNELNILLVHFSSNYVFDGVGGEYSEDSQPNPQSIYSKSKYEGEQAVIGLSKQYFLIRTAVLFGKKGESELSKKSFVDLMLELSRTRQQIDVVADEINSLTYAVDLAGQIKLLLSGSYESGIYHITNTGQASWYDFAKEIFKITGKNIKIMPVGTDDFPRKAKRPKRSILVNTKLPQLQAWQLALKDFLLIPNSKL